MLNFLKKLFAKEEIEEETIELDKLGIWLDQKTKPIFDSLNIKINGIIEKINNEKEKVKKNLEILKNAKLQNPKIPERVKTIMEGNRASFIKKTSFFFNNIDFEYNNHNEILEKCNTTKNEIDSFEKGTARSYQILNEFFAREAEHIASNIKNIENYSNEIKNLIKNSKISNIEKIKNGIADIQNKIKLKENLTNNLKNGKNNLENNKNKLLETENKINAIKSGQDYTHYKNLLEEKNNAEAKLNDIENILFHDFSVLEKALKKYAKIAFENEKLILEYLNNPIITLIKDNEFKIIKILDSLKNAMERNELELDEKKKVKAIEKINELDGVYLSKIKDDFRNTKKRLNDVKYETENNNSKKNLDSLNDELKNINQNIENLNNNIADASNELEKINIEKSKEDLQDEINDVANAKITVL